MNVSRRRYMGGEVDVPFDRQYFTFEALEAGTFTLTMKSGIPVHATNGMLSISYSLDDGRTWTTTTRTTTDALTITTPSVAIGGKVLWKGSGGRISGSSSAYSTFSATGNFVVYGNIFSLFKGDNFAGTTSSAQAQFIRNLFQNNTKLISSENLILPSTYVGTSSYSYTFYGCSNMVKSPCLPAKTLSTSSYYNLFQNCSSLTYIKCLATDISESYCLSNWVKNVGETGTFVKDANTTWPTGVNGIPSGWTVIDE